MLGWIPCTIRKWWQQDWYNWEATFNEYMKIIGNVFGYNGSNANETLQQIKRWLFHYFWHKIFKFIILCDVISMPNDYFKEIWTPLKPTVWAKALK